MTKIVAMRRGARRFSILALVATIALTGCASGSSSTALQEETAIPLVPLTEVTPLENPRSWEGPTTAIVPDPSIEPLSDPGDQTLPATVVSHDLTGDVEQTVTDTSRVIALSLSGTLAELVYAYGMGDSLVGRDISTQLPGLEDLPVITKSGHSVDGEGMLALNPTLILTDGTVGPNDVVLQLRDAGIPVVMISRESGIEGTYETAREVAEALGIGQTADVLIENLQEAIAVKETEIARLLPTDPNNIPSIAFLYVRGTAGIYYLFGEGSGADFLIESVGARDVAREIGWVGEKPMTDEALVKANPDIILVMTKGLASADGIDGLITAQPSIALTNAGKNRRIIDIADTSVFSGGTRIPDIMDALARAVYAPESLEAPAS